MFDENCRVNTSKNTTILYLGYRYYSKRKNGNSFEYWVGVECKASNSDSSIIVRDDYTHLPDEADKIILEMGQNLKWTVIKESDSIHRLVEETYDNIQ